jgi:hypothetical protein
MGGEPHVILRRDNCIGDRTTIRSHRVVGRADVSVPEPHGWRFSDQRYRRVTGGPIRSRTYDSGAAAPVVFGNGRGGPLLLNPTFQRHRALLHEEPAQRG